MKMTKNNTHHDQDYSQDFDHSVPNCDAGAVLHTCEVLNANTENAIVKIALL